MSHPRASRPVSVLKVYPKLVMIQVTTSFEISKRVVAVFPQVGLEEAQGRGHRDWEKDDGPSGQLFNSQPAGLSVSGRVQRPARVRRNPIPHRSLILEWVYGSRNGIIQETTWEPKDMGLLSQGVIRGPQVGGLCSS